MNTNLSTRALSLTNIFELSLRITTKERLQKIFKPVKKIVSKIKGIKIVKKGNKDTAEEK